MFQGRGGWGPAAAVALTAASLAAAPGAGADEAGPWPGTEGKILVDGPLLIDPATGKATPVPNQSGWDAAWAPDGSRLVSTWSQISSIRPSGSTQITLP